MKKWVLGVALFLLLPPMWLGESQALSVKIAPSLFDLAGAGSTVVIQVNIEDVSDLGGLEFKLAFNPSVLDILSASDVVEGAFLSEALVWRKDISTPGLLKYGATMDSAANGSGTLVEITFAVLNHDACTRLQLQEVVLVDTSIPPNKLEIDSIGNGLSEKCKSIVTIFTNILDD